MLQTNIYLSLQTWHEIMTVNQRRQRTIEKQVSLSNYVSKMSAL